MADNLTTQSGTPATVPSATTIATDDIAGIHYQRVKLVDGTLDGTGAIGGDATHGLDVDVTRVQGTVTVSGPLTDTQLRATPVPVSGTVTITDGAGAVTVDGTVAVSSVAGTVTVDGSGVTQPVSAAALPLPTGAATSAAQTTGNSSLSSIDGKVPALGQALAADSVPVVLTASQVTTLTPPAAITGFATAVKQPALGTAGTASADVITVQGIASGTALTVTSTPSTATAVRGSSSATGTSDTSVIAAAGSGLKNYITSISIANTGTATSLITLKDGSGGSTLLTTLAPALGGSNITLPVPIATTANTALYFACGTAATTIYITAVGYTGV